MATYMKAVSFEPRLSTMAPAKMYSQRALRRMPAGPSMYWKAHHTITIV